MTSRELSRGISAAKRTVANGPVVITDDGRPAHVLLSIADYERLAERAGRMASRLWAPDAGDLPVDGRHVSERDIDP